MFGNSEEKKIKKEIKKKAGTYTYGYNVPEGMKKEIEKAADEMNKYVGEKIIHIDDD